MIARLYARFLAWLHGTPWPVSNNGGYPPDGPTPTIPLPIRHAIMLRMQGIDRREYGTCARISYIGDKGMLCSRAKGSVCGECKP